MRCARICRRCDHHYPHIVTDKVSVDLSGPSQTMLTTLYLQGAGRRLGPARSWATSSPRRRSARIDYDWGELEDRQPLDAAGDGPHRAVRHLGAPSSWPPIPTATVIHLGCGLDSRVFRLDPGPGVQWYDVDYPAVISLREKVFPSRPNYHLVATPATDPSWLDEIPADRPTLLLAEGISMYLTEDDGIALLQHVIDRFGSGELQIDFYNWLVVRVAEDPPPATAVRFDAVLGGQQAVRRSRPVSGRPIARRRDVFRRQHLRPSVGGRSALMRQSGPAAPAAAPNVPVPPLRVRTALADAAAACCSATLRISSVRMASIDFSGSGPCEWYSTLSCSA